MDKHTRENLLYMGEELMFRYASPLRRWCLVMVVGGAMVWGFQKVDAYLTPSYAKESAQAFQSAQAPHHFSGKSGGGQAREMGRESRVDVPDRIEIPKLGVEAPLSFVYSTRPADFLEPLRRGVVHYPSALPGEQGAAIILGHSSPLPWLGSDYKRVFSNLKDLERGDLVSVWVRGKKHTYRVAETRVLHRGQDIPQEFDQSGKSKLLLLSCWPPGIDNKRIMVQADLIKTYE